jgi:uncharacterized protein YndB with AHSA1/START domain
VPKGAKKRAAKKVPSKKAAPSRVKKAAPKKSAPSKKRAPARKKSAAGKKAAPKRKAAAKKPAPKRKATPVRASALERLSLVTELPVSPEAVIDAWLDSAAHTAFTGAEAIIEPRVGGKHSAWSGYIEGSLHQIDPDRLVMSWRTTEFAPTDPDSRVELRVRATRGGARLELEHTDLPAGGAEKYAAGWRDFYFVPMARYFSR